MNGEQKDSVRKEIVVDENKRGKTTTKSAPSSGPQKEGEHFSRRKSLIGRSPSGKLDRKTWQDYLKGKCTKPSSDFWHPPE